MWLILPHGIWSLSGEKFVLVIVEGHFLEDLVSVISCIILWGQASWRFAAI